MMKEGSVMDLIDRYVHEVGQHLPARMREDVQAELRSLLTESLEEQARTAGRAPDASLAADVLRTFGAPREVAARYAPEPQYLIGPRLFPVYVKAVKILVGVLVGVFLVLIAVGLFTRQGDLPVASTFVRVGGGFLPSLLFNLGLLTLIFAVVERVQHQREAVTQAFDPAKLPPLDDPDRISYFGRVFFLWMTAAVAVLFNFYPQWVGIVVIHNADVRVIRLLQPEFGQYLPFLNTVWALTFLLTLVVLRHGRWRLATRWAEFGLEVCSAAILVAIVTGPPVFTYDPLVKSVLSVFIVIAVIRAGVQVVRILKRRRP